MTAWTNLCARYPSIKCVDVAECGHGWHDIIEGTFIALLYVGFTGRVVQVKEKSGELRISLEHVANTPLSVIQECETQCAIASRSSRSICEVCGAPGRQRNHDGWLVTSCDGCFRID